MGAGWKEDCDLKADQNEDEESNELFRVEQDGREGYTQWKEVCRAQPRPRHDF